MVSFAPSQVNFGGAEEVSLGREEMIFLIPGAIVVGWWVVGIWGWLWRVGG